MAHLYNGHMLASLEAPNSHQEEHTIKIFNFGGGNSYLVTVLS